MIPNPDLARLRFNMIEQQIRPWDVLDLEILDLLAQIRREDYVPKAHRSLAFFDMEIPLEGATRKEPGQYMLSPKVEARMLQDLHIKKHETVLEIGSGSGFMAALLAHRAAQVLTLVVVPVVYCYMDDLAMWARRIWRGEKKPAHPVQGTDTDIAKPAPRIESLS